MNLLLCLLVRKVVQGLEEEYLHHRDYWNVGFSSFLCVVVVQVTQQGRKGISVYCVLHEFQWIVDEILPVLLLYGLIQEV